MDVTNTTLISWSFGLAALGYLLLLVYLVSFSHDCRASLNARRMVIAATLSTLWALSALFALQFRQPLAFVTSALLDVTRYGAWFAFLLSVLLPRNGESKATSVGATWFPVACWTLVACGMLIQFALAAGWITPQDWLRTLILHGLAEAVMGLILVEQLFRSVAEDSRWNVKPLCLALLVQFVFDVYLFSDAMMFGQIDGDALSVRGFVHAMTEPLLMLTTERSKDWASKIRLSQ